MGSDKALGLDGFPMLFFQHFWDLLHTDTPRVAPEVIDRGGSCRHINHIFLVLLPKKEEALELKDFCFISLLNDI